MIIVMIILYGSRLRRALACIERAACSLEIKTRSQDNCMAEFMKVEFINVNYT